MKVISLHLKNIYTYLPADKEADIANTGMHVKAFPLSHGNPYESTAFLIRCDSSYLLYLGDTGADEIEKTGNLHTLWQQIAPLVQTKKLRAIFIEVSYPDQQPVGQLFGHLTPKLLIQEMENLRKLTGGNAIEGLNVLITHMKPSGDNETQIKQQLLQLNTLKLHLIFPLQSQMLKL